MVTDAPEGYVKLAWSVYPSLRGEGRQSKLHLETTERDGALCGARPAKSAYLDTTNADYEERERTVGLCSRCWTKAGTTTGTET